MWETTPTPLGAVIKVEQVDDSYTSGQEGDILDILNHKANTSTSDSADVIRAEPLSSTVQEKTRKRKRKNNAEKVPSENLNLEKKIKEEPVDDYAQFNPFSASNSQSHPTALQSSTSAPVVTNAVSVSTTRPDSLSQLSKQVEKIATIYGPHNQYQRFQIPEPSTGIRIQFPTSVPTAGQFIQYRPPMGTTSLLQPRPPACSICKICVTSDTHNYR